MCVALFLGYYQLELFGLVLILAEILTVTFVFMVATSFNVYSIFIMKAKTLFLISAFCVLLLIPQENYSSSIYFYWEDSINYLKNDLVVIYITLYVTNSYSIFFVGLILFIATFLIMHGVSITLATMFEKKTKQQQRHFVINSQEMKSQRLAKPRLFKVNSL